MREIGVLAKNRLIDTLRMTWSKTTKQRAAGVVDVDVVQIVEKEEEALSRLNVQSLNKDGTSRAASKFWTLGTLLDGDLRFETWCYKQRFEGIV